MNLKLYGFLYSVFISYNLNQIYNINTYKKISNKEIMILFFINN